MHRNHLLLTHFWLSPCFANPVPASAVEEAFGACARLAADRRWALFYVRPKVHMMQHVVLLGQDCWIGVLP